jgi:hypothetical protein
MRLFNFLAVWRFEYGIKSIIAHFADRTLSPKLYSMMLWSCLYKMLNYYPFCSEIVVNSQMQDCAWLTFALIIVTLTSFFNRPLDGNVLPFIWQQKQYMEDWT